MTYKQKRLLEQMRSEGRTPAEMAVCLDVSVNTVRSHIRRHTVKKPICKCLLCGQPIEQIPGRKEKKFCSDKCRTAYWNKKRGNANG